MRLRTSKAFPYLAAVPIPRFDAQGEPLDKAKIEGAVIEVVEAFTGWFGGAKVISSAGAYRMMDGTIILDDNEPAVVSMMSRAEFRKRKSDIERLVDRLATELDQESMAVIACPAEGFLVFRGKQ